MCHRCGWGVASGAGPHVLQHQARWQVTAGEERSFGAGGGGRGPLSGALLKATWNSHSYRVPVWGRGLPCPRTVPCRLQCQDRLCLRADLQSWWLEHLEVVGLSYPALPCPARGLSRKGFGGSLTHIQGGVVMYIPVFLRCSCKGGHPMGRRNEGCTRSAPGTEGGRGQLPGMLGGFPGWPRLKPGLAAGPVSRGTS